MFGSAHQPTPHRTSFFLPASLRGTACCEQRDAYDAHKALFLQGGPSHVHMVSNGTTLRPAFYDAVGEWNDAIVDTLLRLGTPCAATRVRHRLAPS